MHYVKITTSEDETRWINLQQVCRFTYAHDAARGYPVLAMVFSTGSDDDKLIITGSNEADLKAIETLTAALDAVSRASST